MASRLSFHSQLSSIMETMAKSALSQVCKLVDEDSVELRSELSRLLLANSALVEKINSLECELTIVRCDTSQMCKSNRSVGVQTVCCRDEDTPDVSGPPTIEGIFGKDWCMNLWKDRDPYSLQTCTESPRSPEKSVESLSDQIMTSEIKDEAYVQDASTTSQQETFDSEEHEESMAEDSEQLTVDYLVDGSSTCSLSSDESGEQITSTGSNEETAVQMISVDDADEAFSSHTIPIELEEEEDDDVQFVQASQQEPAKNAAAGPSRDKRQTLPTNSTETLNQSKDSHGDFSMLSIQHNRASKMGTFICQICDRTFFHKGTLTHHMKSHKSNFCSICKQHFPHRNKLNSHNCVAPVPSQRICRSCELCGKTFANPSALRIHYVVHTGEKPYRCSLCGKRFTQKGNLKCHLRIHTGDRPFRCVKCGKTFTQKVNLNHHLMAHLNREVVEERPVSQKQVKNTPAESRQ